MENLNRRDFVKFLALLAAGASALPQQVEAFEKYYEANSPFADGLVAVDEIMISGMAQKSTPIAFTFYRNDREAMNFGVNLYGGIMRWLAAPDQKIIVSEADFFWKIKPYDPEAAFDIADIIGTVSFINSQRQRKTVRMTQAEGSLVDP